MDTKTRAQIAAAARWGNRTTKNKDVIYVTEKLAKALKAGAKERKQAIGDLLEEMLESANKLADMADKLDPEDAVTAEMLRETKRNAEQFKAIASTCFTE